MERDEWQRRATTSILASVTSQRILQHRGSAKEHSGFIIPTPETQPIDEYATARDEGSVNPLKWRMIR